jgi:putative ABC transport system substrate-binding protein
LSAWREGTVGGRASRAPSRVHSWHKLRLFAGRILKGAKPADLPVVQSARFELVLNLRTAKALGLEVPPLVLAIAVEVIE